MHDRIIDCGNGNAVKLNTNSPAKVVLTIRSHDRFLCVCPDSQVCSCDAYICGTGVEMNFEQAHILIGHLQGWIDDNPEGETCELNEDIVADNLLNGG